VWGKLGKGGVSPARIKNLDGKGANGWQRNTIKSKIKESPEIAPSSQSGDKG